ncbi:efflux RND transporter permease subunit [Leptolyngbya sp. 15MV]|nr:efflux RND transporter permease subunit [Leptolyngbya sp. 15MV]
MRLARFFIDRPVFAAVLSIAITLVGAIAALRLPIAEYPDIAPPTVQVTALYPGASAETIAATVAGPIEQEVNGVEGMLYIASQSTGDGRVTVSVVFRQGTDVDQAQVLVQNRVAIAEPRLPEEVRRLGVTVLKASPDLLMVVHLTSPDGSRSQEYISNFATLNLRDRLARLDGVGNAQVFGARDYAMRTSTATATFSYDANGSMIGKTAGTVSWSFVWDDENRLVSASDGTDTVEYSFDALGRRVKRTQGGTVEKYTYDGLDVIQDDTNGTITKYQNGLGIDNKLKMLVGEQVKYFLQDHLGSTVGLADASGNLTSSANYDSFGNSTNNLPTRYQYTGREYDSFSGLQYNRARWYDPKIGRFFSEDPIGLNGGLNLYEYAKSNPVSYTDPTGEIPNPYDFFWWLYYSMRCGEDGIQCGNACNSSNQSQAELELTMQEAFDSGAGNFTGLR